MMRLFTKIRLFDFVARSGAVAATILVGACAEDHGITTLSPVGPNSISFVKGAGLGHLIVHNASHETLNHEGAMTYPHNAYKIYNTRGSCIKRICNRSGAEGESPERVDLPPGRYTIVALSENQGVVAVPVIIESQLATEVNLERPKRIIIRNSSTSY